jgi:hypothetical protein
MDIQALKKEENRLWEELDPLQKAYESKRSEWLSARNRHEDALLREKLREELRAELSQKTETKQAECV